VEAGDDNGGHFEGHLAASTSDGVSLYAILVQFHFSTTPDKEMRSFVDAVGAEC
jgi:hypothetical protein